MIPSQYFSELERELMLLATHFIQKDKAMRSASNFKRKPATNDVSVSFSHHSNLYILQGGRNELNIASYAHREVDRFGVLYDIWTNECAFQEAKKEVCQPYRSRSTQRLTVIVDGMTNSAFLVLSLSLFFCCSPQFSRGHLKYT